MFQNLFETGVCFVILPVFHSRYFLFGLSAAMAFSQWSARVSAVLLAGQRVADEIRTVRRNLEVCRYTTLGGRRGEGWEKKKNRLR